MPDPKDTTTKKEQELNEELEQKNQRDKAYFKNVDQRVADTTGIHKKYDTQRYTKKAQMSQLIASWREELKDDKEVLKDKTLEKLLKDMEAYAAMDVTATHSTTMGDVDSARRELNEVEKSVKEESKQLTNLAKNVQKYIEELETKSEQILDAVEEEALIARRQVMAQNIQLLIEEQMNGYLPEISEDACHIRAKDKNIATLQGEGFSDYRNMPLFPHDPSPSDIKQGYIGDCYMVSVLANIAKTDPDKIKEAFRDNGDGTVTVRLFQRTVSKYEDYFAPDATPPTKMEPFYVTVDKTIPRETSARNCLWAALIEKAVVASGLSVDKRYSGTYARPVPDNIEELYEKYKNMREDQRPSKIECPWLFDKNNNLVKWKADYAQIEGGHAQMFAESFLGEGYEAVKEDVSPTRTDGARDIIYDFLMMQVGKATNPDYEEKARKILESQGDAAKRLYNATRLLRGLKNKDIDINYTPSFTANGELEKLDKISHDSDRSYQGFVESVVNPLSGCLIEGSIKYPEGNFVDVVSSTIEKAIDDKLKEQKYNSKEQQTLKDLVAAFKQDKEQILSGVSGRKYPISYEKKFEEIKNELAAGHIVAAASPQSPEGDVDLKGGIFYSHAYNVIGTEEETIDGKDYKFVVMRNPHGSAKVPVYDYNFTPPKATNGIVADAQGIFKMELSHFVSNLDYLTINGKEMSGKEKQDSDKMKLGYIQQNIMGKYDRVFTELDKNLEKAMKEDPENKEAIKEIKDTIQKNILVKEDVIGDVGYFRALSVHAKEILDKNPNLKPASKRFIQAAADFARMRVNNIKDPMAEIRKEKTMNNLGESEKKESFYDGSKLTEEFSEYAVKKREMLKKKDNFEKQKERREEVINQLSGKYSKEEINNFIHNYEAEEKSLEEYSKTWNLCNDAKNKAKIHEKKLDAKVSECYNKITAFREKNEKEDRAVEKLKECLKAFEEKQKEASNPSLENQKKKETPEEVLKKLKEELDKEKQDIIVVMENRTPEEKEYVQLHLDDLENKYGWVDEDKKADLEKKISPMRLRFWKARFQKLLNKQIAYDDKKYEIESAELQDEFGDYAENDPESVMLKEAFDFKKESFNPLATVPVKDYVTEAQKYISQVEKSRMNREKDLENLQNLYNEAKKERDDFTVKLKQVEAKEKETRREWDNLLDTHSAKKNDYTMLKEARDSYNAAYKEAFENTEKLEMSGVEEEIKRIAGEILDKQNLNASGHSNSPEFNRMIQALTILKNWPNIDEVCKDIPKDKRPTSLEGALDHLKKQAEKYKIEKDKQIHIFKTAIYKTRMSMANSIIDFAKTTKKDLAMDNKAERAELNSYFENKGRSNEELKAEKNKNEATVSKETKENITVELENGFERC